MPKCWGKQIFSLRSFPEVGQKQKTEKKRLNDGNNNGQATHGARKPPGSKVGVWHWRPQACLDMIATCAKNTEVMSGKTGENKK